MAQKYKGVLLLFIPFLYGLAAIKTLFIFPFLSQLVMGVFWFWMGMRLAQSKRGKLNSFLLGNSVWAISFMLALYQQIPEK